jgi:hypothetical protein
MFGCLYGLLEGVWSETVLNDIDARLRTTKVCAWVS